MIKKEFYKKRNDGKKLYKSYSDKNLKIKQLETEIIFDEAIDVEDAAYTYEETNQVIEEAIDMSLIDNLWKEVALNEFDRT